MELPLYLDDIIYKSNPRMSGWIYEEGANAMKHRQFLQKVAEKLPPEATQGGLPKPKMVEALETGIAEVVMETKPHPKRSTAKAVAQKMWGKLFSSYCRQCREGGKWVFKPRPMTD